MWRTRAGWGSGVLAAFALTGAIVGRPALGGEPQWQGPPAILISGMEDPPRWGYQSAIDVSDGGRFALFYRSRRDGPSRVILRNVARARNRAVTKPHSSFEPNDEYRYGKVRAFGYRAP